MTTSNYRPDTWKRETKKLLQWKEGRVQMKKGDIQWKKGGVQWKERG